MWVTDNVFVQLSALEFSQYLEAYLWPAFEGGSATLAHVMSIVLMVNQKFSEGSDAWAVSALWLGKCMHLRVWCRA